MKKNELEPLEGETPIDVFIARISRIDISKSLKK